MKKRNNMSPERNASPPKKKKYITQFQDSWVKEWPGKIAMSHKGNAYALCRLCRSDFGIGSGKTFILFFGSYLRFKTSDGCYYDFCPITDVICNT